jgi:hypothetical protein
MKGLRSLTIVAALMTSSCSVVGIYEWNAVFAGEALELKADQTFLFYSWSDEIDPEHPDPIIGGTWMRVGRNTVVTTITSTTDTAHLPIRVVQRWRKTSRGIIPVSGSEFLRRSRE